MSWYCGDHKKSFRTKAQVSSHIMKQHGAVGVMWIGDTYHLIESIKPSKKKRKK